MPNDDKINAKINAKANVKIDIENLDSLQQKFPESSEFPEVSSPVSPPISPSSKKQQENPKKTSNHLKSRLIAKDFFDTVGYSFNSQQFVNIFFFLSGAGFFLIGLITGFKTILSVISSSVVSGYKRSNAVYKRIVMVSGIIFAVLLIALAFSVQIHAVITFSIILLLIGIFVVLHGDFYMKLKESLKLQSRRMAFLKKYSLIITAACLLITGYVLDRINVAPLFGINFNNSFIMFSISALAILLGVLMVYTIKSDNNKVMNEERFSYAVYSGMKSIFLSFSSFMKDKLILMLILSGMLVSTVQILGSAYYGVFIYQNLGKYGFGPYMNVAVVFTIAALASMIGPFISRINAKEYGKVPMLVFGTLLMAIMPLTFYYNPNIVSISMGTLIGIIGAAISGVATGLLSSEIVPDTKRDEYFSMLGVFSVLPCIITVPAGAWIASFYGLPSLFLLLGVILVLVACIYFGIVILHHKKNVKM